MLLSSKNRLQAHTSTWCPLGPPALFFRPVPQLDSPSMSGCQVQDSTLLLVELVKVHVSTLLQTAEGPQDSYAAFGLSALPPCFVSSVNRLTVPSAITLIINYCVK